MIEQKQQEGTKCKMQSGGQGATATDNDQLI